MVDGRVGYWVLNGSEGLSYYFTISLLQFLQSVATGRKKVYLFSCFKNTDGYVFFQGFQA